MKFFSFSKKSPSLSIVFDIREFSLTAAVVEMFRGKKSEIISCQTFEVIESEIASYKKYSESLIKTIDRAIIETHKSLISLGIKNKISNHFFFVGSPWVVSKGKSIKLTKDKAFSVDGDFLKRVLVGKEENLKKEIEKESERGGWEVFEEKIVEAKLNGYKVDSFYNRKAKEFEVHLFTSFIAKEINDKIKTYSNKKLKGDKSCSHSQTLSTFTFTRDLFQNKNNFIYVDIGKLITDIYVVIDDTIHGIASFPFGENAIIENIAKDLKMTKDLVLSTLNIKCHGKCDEDTDIKVNNFIKTGLSKWSENFNGALKRICEEKDAPLEIMMIANTDLSNLFVEKIKNQNSETPFKIYGKNPHLTIIGEGVLNNFINGGKVFKNQPYIKMDIILLDKLIKQNNICLKN
ncbi:MAG: hypothetical protein WC229_00180 [Candidatus Paceibacterota bacterium]|jgi:hypothetical protein